MNFYENVNRIFADWNYGHPYILYGLIRAMKPRVAVEIGTYRGFGAAWMAKALQENNKGTLYAVDNFSLTDHEAKYGDARRHLVENLTKLGVIDFVRILDGDSINVQLPEQIDFAYIDGWHGYTAARADFAACAERGATVICLDDVVSCVGPRMLVDEIRKLDNTLLNSPLGEWQVCELLSDNGIAVCVRKQLKPSATFSQELPPPHGGVMLDSLTKEEQESHFTQAAKVNDVCYSAILPQICLAKGERPTTTTEVR